MAKVLEMIFETVEGKSATIAVENPKHPVHVNTIKLAMEQMIAGNVFVSASGGFVGVKGARLVERNVEELELG
ncbi:DUF2922 domain-containing protein [Peribacillus muralis]|uniref:DUF2922 family protein n=1 Tax=Peribacillus muralis TaxID=264697 RepID=UPI001F4EB55D|nr:DUF2922 domain-containing protein [Peribacillus muralis]MCK2012695.1 DUF2922 domain-containing protein [Peribacillus muralis]